MSKQISPLPWALNSNVRDCINDAAGDFFLAATCARNGDDEANAAFIVKACNSHDKLVVALRKAAEHLEACGIMADSNNDGISCKHAYDGLSAIDAALAAAGEGHE